MIDIDLFSCILEEPMHFFVNYFEYIFSGVSINQITSSIEYLRAIENGTFYVRFILECPYKYKSIFLAYFCASFDDALVGNKISRE